MMKIMLPVTSIFLITSLPVLSAGDGNSYRGGGANIFFALLVFLAVIVLAVYGTRWMARLSGGSRGRILRIAESVYLGPNRGLHLVLVGKNLFLLGQGDHGMNLIAELNDKELVALAKQHLADGNPAQGGFAKQFQQLLAKDDQDGNASFVTSEQLLGKLKNIRQKKARGEKND